MGYKSRGCFTVNICLKDCLNQGKSDICASCFRDSNYIPAKDEDDERRDK